MKEIEAGRIALREEGNNWNAYYARQGTMGDAIFLGSLCMTAARNPKHKQKFMDLMRDVISDVLQEVTGQQPSWKDPQPAPEHERTKE